MSQVNDNANEAVQTAKAIGVGTQVTSISSSSEGYVTDNLYLNNSTWDLWKCTGTDTWELQGNIEGATGATGQQGLPGENGQDGTDGTNGTNSYIWVRYSESADGTGFDATPTPAKKYMGVYAGTSSTAPTNKTAYAWVKYIGEDGQGAGDMLKSTYDTNNNGKVDDSEKLGGQLPSYYQQSTNGLTEETAIADADTMSFYDASENENRKSTWANIVSKLKDYFDTLYNNYVLPTASVSVKGGIKIGNGLTISNEVLSANVKGLINNKTDFDAQTVSTSQAVDSLLVKELLDDIDVSGGGGAGNVINITTTEEDLFMQTVTATSENGEIATAKFNIVGQATLYAPFTGLITISASNASGTEDSTKKIMSYNFKDFNIEMKFNELYGFCVDTTNNSPSGAVTYLTGYDNELYTPAFMDYTTGKFNYGDWENAFFLSESRWVMLKSDGTIDYDLDRENHAKKASDGSASDVGNEAYDGNAMFACVNSYIKFWQEEGDLTKLYFAVSKKPLDGFQNYAHHDNNGNTMPYTFIRMFDGTLVSGKLRSLANNATPLNSATGTDEIGYAQANGDYWYTGLYNDRVLINNLLLLMGKSRDTQTTFGNGHYTGGSSAANFIKTGTMLDKGLFYGTNGTGVGVKVFGIENWWGNIWERIGGYMYVSNLQQVKLTYGTEDGSTTTGYNTTGSGYIAIPNSTIGGTSGGYTSAVSFYDKGFVPKTVSGSQSTHWCDGCGFSNGSYARVGGTCNAGFLAGAFCVNLDTAVSGAHWSRGASVSCKPPVA